MDDKLQKLEQERATEFLRNPVSDAELTREARRGNLLVYERASDAQLSARKNKIENRLAERSMPITDVTRHVVGNMVYAMGTFTLSLWFAGQKALQLMPKVSKWLVDKNFLRDGLTNYPYVANIKEFEQGIVSMAASWGHDARGNSASAAAKRLEIITDMRGLLSGMGFNRSAQVLGEFLETHAGKDGLTTNDVFGDLLGRLQAADKAAAAKKGVKPDPSMATKILGFFLKAEQFAIRGGGALVHSKLQAELAEQFSISRGGKNISPAAISQRIYNTRMGPVIVGAAAVGAAAVGVFSYNQARERRAMLSAADLTFIDQVQQQRDDHRHAASLPGHHVAASTAQHESLVVAPHHEQLAR